MERLRRKDGLHLPDEGPESTVLAMAAWYSSRLRSSSSLSSSQRKLLNSPSSTFTVVSIDVDSKVLGCVSTVSRLREAGGIDMSSEHLSSCCLSLRSDSSAASRMMLSRVPANKICSSLEKCVC